MAFGVTRTPLVIGKSGARVYRVQRESGEQWIEKSGSAHGLGHEAAVINWCRQYLPAPRVIALENDVLSMSLLPGVNLTEVSMQCAVSVLTEALRLVHAVPVRDCPFQADWATRLNQAEVRVRARLVDESDFDDVNLGRTADDILAELRSQPPLPSRISFTHGDACLPNFLCDCGELSGVVDLGRAGITHPAQDWALALRSMRRNFGSDGERLLLEHLPDDSVDERLLRRFRLLDELF
jgi:aminoglycoside 3'-phosphotransferase II